MTKSFALVMPRSTFLEDSLVFGPLGLWYIASRLESLGHKVDFYDLNVDPLPADTYDEIWVSATSPQLADVKRIAREMSEYKAKRILGGACVWANPDSCRDIGYDLIVGGEADSPTGIQQILESTREYEFIPVSRTLDWVLPPSRKWVSKYHSRLVTNNGLEIPCTTMFTSRGCPLECIEENQLVLMADWSWRKIKDIRVGDMVMGMSEGGKFRKSKITPTEVLGVYDKGIKDTITISDDLSEICLTANHKVYADDGNKTRWKLAGSVISNKYKFRKIHRFNKKNRTEFRRGWLAGYIAGDGCIYYSNGRGPYINVTSRDAVLLETVKKWAREFGCEFRDFTHNMGNSAFPTKHDPKYIGGVICTKTSETKKFISDIVDPFVSLSKDYCAGWLAGIYDSDGTLDSGGSCRIHQSEKVKPHNTLKIETYLDELDLSYTIQHRQDQEGMNIYVVNQTDFLMACPAVLARKHPKEHEYRCFPQTTVTEVHPSGSKHVYDLTTTTHTFICQGYVVHNCAFCESGRHGVIWDRLTRYEPIESVEEQIREVASLGYHALAYYDDILPISKKRITELMALHQKYDMVWRCFLRSDIINNQGGYDYLREMRDGGLIEIFVGVESADNEIKNNITKKTTIEQDTNIVRWCKDLGIRCKTSFILGLPGETFDSMEKTRLWILENRPDRVQVGRLIPFSGTPLTKHPENYDLKYERMPDDSWFYMGMNDFQKSFVSTSHLSVDDIDQFWHKLNAEMKELGIPS